MLDIYDVREPRTQCCVGRGLTRRIGANKRIRLTCWPAAGVGPRARCGRGEDARAPRRPPCRPTANAAGLRELEPLESSGLSPPPGGPAVTESLPSQNRSVPEWQI